MSKVISFSSGKGGVGKTTLVTNLGKLWAGGERKVLLVDGDWSLGKLSITFGLKPQWTVDRVLNGEISLEAAIQKIAPNLYLLASPSGKLGFEQLDSERRQTLFYELENCLQTFDIVLMDHGSGVDDDVLHFAAAAHQQIIVTTPEPTSYTDAYAIMKLLSKRYGVREFWLLVTMGMAGSEVDATIHRYCDMVRTHLGVRLNLLDLLPWEPKLSESIRKRQPFVTLYPQAKLTDRFRKICMKVESSIWHPSNGLQFLNHQRTQEETCRT